MIKQVIYIGETGAGLSGRWSTFERAAFGKGGSHAGGNTYREAHYPNPQGALYIAAMTSSPLQWRNWAQISDNDLKDIGLSQGAIEELNQDRVFLERDATAREKGPLNKAWLKFVERKLLFEFTLIWGNLPVCNKE